MIRILITDIKARVGVEHQQRGKLKLVKLVTDIFTCKQSFILEYTVYTHFNFRRLEHDLEEIVNVFVSGVIYLNPKQSIGVNIFNGSEITLNIVSQLLFLWR